MIMALEPVSHITDLRGLSYPEIRERLQDMPPDEERRLLEDAIFGSAEHIYWSACIATDLADKGEELNLIYADEYRKIAEGSMPVEVFVRIAGRPRLMQKLEHLAPSEQKRLIVDGETVPVAELTAGGEVTYRRLRVTEIPEPLYRQVFSDSGVRGEGEQAAIVKYDANRTLPPVKERQPVELESLRAELRRQESLLGGDKRQAKKAAAQIRVLGEKIQLLVQ